jgi:voltage-gated potassium channel
VFSVFKRDNELKDHIIICGLGATAMQIIEVLESSHDKSGHSFHDYLVIDSSEEAIEKVKAKWPNINCMPGDATDDDVLEQARIKEAYGIFPVLSSEKDNLYITMAARQLNPRIRIIARTSDVYNIGNKLFKGGANSVVSPNFLGGLRLVSEIVRPNATEFLDELLHDVDTKLLVSEVIVSHNSWLCGRSLKEIDLPKKCGLNIIAIRKHGHQFYTYNPSAMERIDNGDTVVVLGYRDQTAKLESMAKGDD